MERQKQNLRRFRRKKRHGRDGVPAAGKGFAEHLALRDGCQDHPVAPQIFLEHLYGAGERDSNPFHLFAGQRNKFPFVVGANGLANAMQDGLYVFLNHSLKKGKALQLFCQMRHVITFT